MSETTRLVTAAELERFPDDDQRYELVEGRLVRMRPVAFLHSRVVAQLMWLLMQHARPRDLGFVGTELGFKLRSSPDTVRAPDVSFIRASRVPSVAPSGFWTGPPDLAIEVLSPDDRPGDVRDKVDDYLATGVPMVVIVDPDASSVTVHRPGATPVTHKGEDQLDLSEVIDGFRCPARAIFE